MSNGTSRKSEINIRISIRNKYQGRGRQKQTTRCRAATEIVEDSTNALVMRHKASYFPVSGHERPNVIGWIRGVIGIVANRVQWLTVSLLGARVCYATRSCPVKRRLYNSVFVNETKSGCRDLQAERLLNTLFLLKLVPSLDTGRIDRRVECCASFPERDLIVRALLRNR